MNILSRIITGIIFIIGGLVLSGIAIWNGFKNGSFIALIYGIPVLIIGFFILFNTKEDKLEQVKKYKGGRKND